jgi:hypothetical protein
MVYITYNTKRGDKRTAKSQLKNGAKTLAFLIQTGQQIKKVTIKG